MNKSNNEKIKKLDYAILSGIRLVLWLALIVVFVGVDVTWVWAIVTSDTMLAGERILSGALFVVLNGIVLAIVEAMFINARQKLSNHR